MVNEIYRYLGYGVTNENGVAKLDHDENGDEIEHSYTGVGAGEVDVIASLDNPIDEGSLVSETYSIFDCIKYDGGTINNHNDIWDTLDANSKFDRYDEYSILSETGTADAYLYLSQLPTSCVLEFEVAYVDGTMGNGFITFYDGNNYKSFFSIQILGYPVTLDTRFFKLRVTYDNGSITCTDLDNTSKTRTNSYTGDINRMRFATGAGTTALKIRDFKVYPI